MTVTYIYGTRYSKTYVNLAVDGTYMYNTTNQPTYLACCSNSEIKDWILISTMIII